MSLRQNNNGRSLLRKNTVGKGYFFLKMFIRTKIHFYFCSTLHNFGLFRTRNCRFPFAYFRELSAPLCLVKSSFSAKQECRKTFQDLRESTKLFLFLRKAEFRKPKNVANRLESLRVSAVTETGWEI